MSSPPSSSSSAPSPAASGSSSRPWNTAWSEIHPALSLLRGQIASWATPTSRIMRVGQLDAELLDHELITMLKEPLNKALAQLGSVYETRYDPEFALVIGAILYKFSMWDKGATYGAKLQDLHYRTTKVSTGATKLAPSGLPQRILALHALLTVVVPYLHTRIRTHALSRAWPDAPSADRKRRVWDALVRLETLHSTLGLIGFITFLYDGRYRTIADRLLGLRLVPSRSIVRRNISYEFMNRQMVWHAFTEFLIFLLPLINARKVRRKVSRIFSRANPSLLLPHTIRASLGLSPSTSDGPGSSSAASVLEEGRRGKFWALSDDQCAICAEDASYNMAHLAEAANANAQALASSASMSSEERYSYRGRPKSAEGAEAPAAEQPSTAVTLTASSDAPPQFPITNPYRASCGHIYCYFCLSERMIRAAVGDDAYLDEDGWECLRCERHVRSAERVKGDDGHADEMGSQDGLSDVDGEDVVRVTA
ncbi:hypothetical protein DL93DRAFT_1855997 [Clavulina sp. PMI_390]|nr:hypothetical protein DL93DRAFT_1855997 [Clavulina sp. PMI_390]